MNSDRIDKKIFLQAPLEHVWRAVADSARFGNWFGVVFEGPFIAGQRLRGHIRPTEVDPEVAKLQQRYEGKAFEIVVDRIEPMRHFSFRWHPYAVEPDVDYSKEPMTLVEFTLEEAAGGTWLSISESGFDRIPLARRAGAFAANDGGWSHQSELIRKYLAAPA